MSDVVSPQVTARVDIWRVSPRFFLSVALFLMSLYDVYFLRIGLAPLPIAGMLVLLAAVRCYPPLSRPESVSRHLFTYLIAALLVLLFFLSSFWGWLRFGEVYFKGAIGLSLGVVVLVVLLARDANRQFLEDLHRSLGDLLTVHVVFWLIQFGYFFATGRYLDFIEFLTGHPSRKLYAGYGLGLTRFTGLFVEPAIYASFMYMGLTMRLARTGFVVGRMELVAIVTVLASLSVYGAFLMALLILTCVVYSGRGVQLLALPLIPVVVVIGLFTLFADSPVTEYVRLRMLAPLQDSSGQTRLLRGFASILESPEEIQLLGKGIGNYDQSLGVTNGVAYLLEYLGMVGTIFFTGLMGALFLLRRVPVVCLWLIGVMLLGSPMFTYFYWWFWVGFLMLCAPGSVNALSRKRVVT
ncbi:MAG: hypothetical protein RMJ43_14745 [Chloroherpetonaceae bacterium]|nr:hypothetical protein [Chthonomonadaceae bacterium]MDW8209091.1 hypothetical protein [Chloroherpetonaceae bacterium]